MMKIFVSILAYNIFSLWCQLQDNKIGARLTTQIQEVPSSKLLLLILFALE